MAALAVLLGRPILKMLDVVVGGVFHRNDVMAVLSRVRPSAGEKGGLVLYDVSFPGDATRKSSRPKPYSPAFYGLLTSAPSLAADAQPKSHATCH